MERKTSHIPDDLYDYLLSMGVREPDVLKRLREETSRMPDAIMQISPDQGAFMALLIKLMRARFVLEVGVFTGYSSLAMALALPEDGRVTALDVSEEWTDVARRYWQQAGVADMIDLVLAPAAETLAELINGGRANSYDFAFIDADKQSYSEYYESALTLVKPGGLVVLDNAFRGGLVCDPPEGDADTAAIDALNRRIKEDERVDICLTTTGDGLMLCRKRG